MTRRATASAAPVEEKEGGGSEHGPASGDSRGSANSALVQLAKVAAEEATKKKEASGQLAASATAQPPQPQQPSPPTSFNLNGPEFSLPLPLHELRSLPTTADLLGSPSMHFSGIAAAAFDEDDPLQRLLREQGPVSGLDGAGGTPNSGPPSKRARLRSPFYTRGSPPLSLLNGATAGASGALLNPTCPDGNAATPRRSGILTAADAAAAAATNTKTPPGDAAMRRRRVDADAYSPPPRPPSGATRAGQERVAEGLRAERNRQAAAASRERRRAIVGDLEARNRILSEQNAQLQIEAMALKREMNEMIRRFQGKVDVAEKERAQLRARAQQLQAEVSWLREKESDTAKLLGLMDVAELPTGADDSVLLRSLHADARHPER